MILAKVVGTVVSTQKIPELKGYKLLIITPVNSNSELLYEQKTYVAIDIVGSGEGDIVLVEPRYAVDKVENMKTKFMAIVAITEKVIWGENHKG